ncbi:MAG: hypothetical protein P0111_04450 [Nitrospira sp.]|nr:hypothetical protein [Nitrospira sp.]
MLTPYLIPESLRGRKVVNIGDGFILRAIERWVGRFSPKRMFSPRAALHDEALEVLEHSAAVIIAGANQLNDRYTIWPGLTAERIKNRRLRLVPFGIGLHGDPIRTERMTVETRLILEAVHEQIEYSSWRCPQTVAFLRRELPQRAGQFLMTGCPVLYDRPLLESDRFYASENAVAVTATERKEFWNRETRVIDAVTKRFRRARRYFVTHQNFSPPGMGEGFRHLSPWRAPGACANRVEALRLYARQQGFKIVIPSSADECIRFYEGVDVHVGSRLHAHLLFLSRNKRSYLVPVDARSVGIAEHFGFPLLAPDALDRSWDCDFELVRARARETYPVMERFVESLEATHACRGD